MARALSRAKYILGYTHEIVFYRGTYDIILTTKTCLLSQLLSKVTVTSCSFYIKCSMCPPIAVLLQKSSCFQLLL